MKRNKLMLAVAASFLLIAGCREKTVWTEDSPYITVSSPTQNGTIKDDDSIRVDAMIKPTSDSIIAYYMHLMDSDKRVICQYRKVYKEPQTTIAIDTAFAYNAVKTSDVSMFIEAQFQNGTYTRDETRFKLVDTRK